MLDDVDNYQALFGALMSDVEDAQDAKKASDTQYNRRAYIRAVFSLIEGETYLRKRYALMLHKFKAVNLSDPEVALLQEEQYRLNNKGEPESQTQFLRLQENIKFAFRMDSKVSGKPYSLETQGQGWEAFLKGIEIRNRITHPKRFEDFEISDQDIANVDKTLDWYKKNNEPLK